MPSCEVCDEKFSKSKHKPIKCAYAECAYEACATCHKRYILDKSYQKPHCMSCKKEWTAEFQRSNFSKSFWDNDFRKAREKVLFEEEKTHLPPLQPEADRLVRISKAKAVVGDIRQKVDANDKKEDQLVSDQRRIHRALEERLGLAMLHYRLANRPLDASEKKVCTVKCPMQDCRGYLSDKYVCGLCHVTICKHCNEEKKEEKADDAKEAEPHICDKDKVATMDEIRRTSKPCPKCGMAISKIDGCDQMFCIAPGCHTAFSWTTGLIETGVIHNPHYFEALRAGNIRDPRHRQHQGACGPMPYYYDIQAKLFNAVLTHDQERMIQYYYQRFVHHRQVTLPRFLDQTARHADRLKYLTGEMDEEKFKQKVYVASLADERKKEERQIMETFVSVGEELFRQLQDINAVDTLKQLEAVTDITNVAIVALDKKHKYAGCVKPHEIKW